MLNMMEKRSSGN